MLPKPNAQSQRRAAQRPCSRSVKSTDKRFVQKLDEQKLLKINEKSVFKGIDFQQLMSCS